MNWRRRGRALVDSAIARVAQQDVLLALKLQLLIAGGLKSFTPRADESVAMNRTSASQLAQTIASVTAQISHGLRAIATWANGAVRVRLMAKLSTLQARVQGAIARLASAGFTAAGKPRSAWTSIRALFAR